MECTKKKNPASKKWTWIAGGWGGKGDVSL